MFELIGMATIFTAFILIGLITATALLVFSDECYDIPNIQLALHTASPLAMGSALYLAMSVIGLASTLIIPFIAGAMLFNLVATHRAQRRRGER